MLGLPATLILHRGSHCSFESFVVYSHIALHLHAALHLSSLRLPVQILVGFEHESVEDLVVFHGQQEHQIVEFDVLVE